MKLVKALALSGLPGTGGCRMNMEMDPTTAGWIGAGSGMLPGTWTMLADAFQ